MRNSPLKKNCYCSNSSSFLHKKKELNIAVFSSSVLYELCRHLICNIIILRLIVYVKHIFLFFFILNIFLNTFSYHFILLLWLLFRYLFFWYNNLFSIWNNCIINLIIYYLTFFFYVIFIILKLQIKFIFIKVSHYIIF